MANFYSAPSSANSSHQARAYETLKEHFKKYPHQILRGKVIARSESIEAGEGVLYLDFPSSMKFEFTGQASFDALFHKNTYTLKKYPKGRSEASVTQNFSKIDNLLISTLAKVLTSLNESSITAFLMGHVFNWDMKIEATQRTLKLSTDQQLSTLKAMELRFNENLELKFISTELADHSVVNEFYVVEAQYPKTLDVFK